MFARKYRIHAVLILSVVAIIVIPQITNRPDKNKRTASANAALEFLQMVDAGNYADSWLITDPYLQKNIPSKDWVAKMAKIREFGALVSRELESVRFTTPTEELPNRELIMLEYATKFEKKELNEIVTVIQGADGRWRVVGYFTQ